MSVTQLPSGLYVVEADPVPDSPTPEPAIPEITCQTCGKPCYERPVMGYTSGGRWDRHSWVCGHGATYDCPDCYERHYAKPHAERDYSRHRCPVCGEGCEYTA